MTVVRPPSRIYFLVSIAALALGLYAGADLRRLSELPPDVPPRGLQYPMQLSVSGRHSGTVTVGSPAELRFLVQSRPIGSTVEIRSARWARPIRLIAQISKLELFTVFLEGLIFFAVNLLVFCPRVDRGAARDFYWCTLLYGLAVLIGGLYYPRAIAPADLLFPFVWLACLTALPVFFLHMTLVFPRRRTFLGLNPSSIRLVAVLAAALFLWQAAGFLRYMTRPDPASWSALQVSRVAAEVFLVASVATGCLILYRSSRALELSKDREQTKWLLWGFTIGVTPYVFLRTLPGLVGLSSSIPPEFDRIFELAIPVAFTFAVIRHQFLDIDIIIRRSLIYGILAGVLSLVYLLIANVLGESLIARFPQSSTLIRSVAIAVPIALFYPTRRWLGQWVDRTFFQLRHSLEQALQEYGHSLKMASSQEEIASTAQSFLKDQLRLESAVVIAKERASWVVCGDWDETSIPELASLEPFLKAGDGFLAAPNSTSRPDLESPDFPDDLDRRRVRVMVPLRGSQSSLGVILLGPKRNDRRFVEEERRLFEGVRAEVEAALERVELVQLASMEALEREKAAALAEFQRNFFAGVAHDLRTPLTSIRWTVENLLDGVGASSGAIRAEPEASGAPSHTSTLQSVLAACNQLGALMNDFLEVSRAKDPQFRPLFGEVDLLEVVKDATLALRPMADARRACFQVHATDGLPKIRGDRDKVQRIVVNLLENALRYSPESVAVDVRLESGYGREVTLLVRDRGPGLSEEDLARVFGRYTQGSDGASPGQRGFGLGLYIVRSFAEMMGGTVEASNHPDGGACFRCTFPKWEAA